MSWWIGGLIARLHGDAGDSRVAPADTTVRRAIAAAILGYTMFSASMAMAQASTLVINAHTGDVLYSYEPDLPFPPASLTKMMTLYMVFDAFVDGRLQPNDPLTVTTYAASQPASRLGLKRGMTITVNDAVLALITKSANDAAVVLAEAISGEESDFARAMTRQAQKLGMNDTVFRNASGLYEAGQLTTARDLGILAMALLNNHPAYYRHFATQSFSWNGRNYANHNPLLGSYEGADGIKTGYVSQSGYNLVGSAERAGQRVIAVVLGSKTPSVRNWAVSALLDYGFERIEGGVVMHNTSSLPAISDPPGG